MCDQQVEEQKVYTIPVLVTKKALVHLRANSIEEAAIIVGMQLKNHKVCAVNMVNESVEVILDDMGTYNPAIRFDEVKVREIFRVAMNDVHDKQVGDDYAKESDKEERSQEKEEVSGKED